MAGRAAGDSKVLACQGVQEADVEIVEVDVKGVLVGRGESSLYLEGLVRA